MLMICYQTIRHWEEWSSYSIAITIRLNHDLEDKPFQIPKLETN